MVAIQVTESNMTFRRASQMHDSTYAFLLPHVSVNVNGDMAISLAYGSSSSYISHAFGLYDPNDDTWW